MEWAAFAPPSCFVGVQSWAVIQMLQDFASDHPTAYDVGQWVLLVLCLIYLYVAVVIKLWNLFLTKRGAEWDKYDKEKQEIEDQEQLRYLEEYERRKAEKKRKKKKSRS